MSTLECHRPLSKIHFYLRSFFCWILSIRFNYSSKNCFVVVILVPTLWSIGGSIKFELLRLCKISIVKTITENHVLDDRNHLGHRRAIKQWETLLFAAHESRCVHEIKSLEWTWSLGRDFSLQITHKSHTDETIAYACLHEEMSEHVPHNMGRMW